MHAMRSNRFKITLKGDEADESLRLNDLIDQLGAISRALNQVDVSISGGPSPSLYYRVTKITMRSPATFEMEAVSRTTKGPQLGSRVVSKFGRDLRSVISGKRPRDSDLELLESYRGLAQPMRKHMAAVKLTFEDDRAPVELPRNLDVKVDEILGPDQVEDGSVVGSLDVIDIHNQRNLFRIYPVVGPNSIRCRFRSSLLVEAIAGINNFVRISGLLHYKRAEKYPHYIDVSSIEVLPKRSESNSLASLRGIADKSAYDGLSSTEYVEKVRDSEW
jgi:hypothetical protein